MARHKTMERYIGHGNNPVCLSVLIDKPTGQNPRSPMDDLQLRLSFWRDLKRAEDEGSINNSTNAMVQLSMGRVNQAAETDVGFSNGGEDRVAT